MWIFTVPTPTVTVVAVSNQIVGQPLTLQCDVATVRGITSRVDIVWSSNGTEVERVERVNISSITSSTVVYTDTYTIPLLRTSDDDKVYQCEVVIDSNISMKVKNSIRLNVIGKICCYCTYKNMIFQFAIVQIFMKIYLIFNVIVRARQAWYSAELKVESMRSLSLIELSYCMPKSRQSAKII